jgi:hypothetical protein
MTAVLNHPGTMSMTKEPTANKGLEAGSTRNAAIASATARLTRAESTPTSDAQSRRDVMGLMLNPAGRHDLRVSQSGLGGRSVNVR